VAGRGSRILAPEIYGVEFAVSTALACILVASTAYPSYVDVISSVGGGVGGAIGEVYLDFYMRAFEDYAVIYTRSLSSALLVAAPISASIIVAYPLEAGYERSVVLHLASTRRRSYLSKLASVMLSTMLPSILAAVLLPLSVSVDMGYSLVSLPGVWGLLASSALLAASYSSMSVLAAVVVRRVGLTLVSGILAGLVARPVLGSGGIVAPLVLLLVSSIAGFIVYARRDLR